MTIDYRQFAPITLLKYLFLLAVILGCSSEGYSQTNRQNKPTDVKILEEYLDAGGNTIRKVQYYEGGRRIVETHIIKPSPRLNDAIDPDTLDGQQMLLIIEKKRMALDIYYRRRKIRTYKVVMGPKPLENKVQKGDRRTPEGWFKILNKHVSGRYNKFLQIDYPNDSSYVRFSRLKTAGHVATDAEIGGDVGIHGVWKGGDNTIEMGAGWTDGCIALTNKDIDEVYRLVNVGTRVLIRK